MDYITGIVILLLVAAATVWYALSKLRARQIVYQFQKALRFEYGALVGVLGPGRHTYWKHRSSIHVFDMRPILQTLAGQEVLSQDSVPLRLSLSVTYEVEDLQKAVFSRASRSGGVGLDGAMMAAYEVFHYAIREVVSGLTVEHILSNPVATVAAIEDRAVPKLGGLGLKGISVVLRDLSLPGEFKKAFSQVVVARQEGLAALERARGETAALRSLANAARMIEDNPNLATLRALQALEQGKGTLVLGNDAINRPERSVQPKSL